MLSFENRINSKKDLMDWIAYERKKYGGGVLRETIPLSENDILRKHQVILRKAEYHTNCKHILLGKIYRLRLSMMQNKFSLHIPINTCGRGLHIMHLGPILINGRATVGRDCSLHINTALVAGGTNDGVPHLSDGVVVGIGAVVLGDTFIAPNVAIGANAVVNRDVSEENIAVAGVPAHKISNSGRLSWNKKDCIKVKQGDSDERF